MRHQGEIRHLQISNLGVLVVGAASNKVAKRPLVTMVSRETPPEQQTSQVGEETSNHLRDIPQLPLGARKKRCSCKKTSEVHDTLGASQRSSLLIDVLQLPLGATKKRSCSCNKTTELHDTRCSGGALEEHPNQPFVPAHELVVRTRKIEQGAEKSDPVVTAPRIYRTREQCRRRINCNDKKSVELEKLNSKTFECFLENLWREFPEDKRVSFTYLDCLWFFLYSTKTHKQKVLDWIKNKNILSKKYIFVPIVRWRHWSLLILCHFGESGPSDSRTRCMLLLDSLQSTNPKHLEPGIRRFILDIYRAEQRSEDKVQVNKIPLLVPKVPQQRNDKECGNFVLYYIKLFLESAPENFSISKGFPYFMTEDWFTYQRVESFYKRLDSIRRTDLDLSDTSSNDSSSSLTDIEIIGTG